MDTNQHESENKALPFQFGMLEVQDNPDAEFRNPQTIQHLTTLDISDLINDFRIYNHRVERDQVRDEFADPPAFVKQLERTLLLARNVSQPKVNDQGVLIRLLVKSVTNMIQNFDGGPDNLENFFLEQQLCRVIRVPSCSLVVHFSNKPGAAR